jgi:mannose-6-phosphate isomerase-like protein (cupin superfamily)
MINKLHLPVFIVLASLCLITAEAQSNTADTVTYYSSSQIDSFLATSTTSPRLIGKTLGRSADNEPYLVGVRAQPGDVEIHEQFDDVAIIRSGHGVLRTGKKVKGQKAGTNAGEWIGGVIEDAQERHLSPGDFIVIPAMLGHQYIPNPGESLTYWTIKVRRARN